MTRHILFDADILAYRCAWSEKDSSAEEAVLKLDELVSNIVGAVDPWGPTTNHYYFLTGRGNYRHAIAKTAVYKGNRKEQPKPEHLGVLREHLILKYNAVVSENCEADDMIATAANRFGYNNVVIVSIDKDFDQIPTTIFNPTKWEWKTVDTWSATKNFYKQILTGDRVDNIIGINGIGPVRAEKLLEGCDSEVSLYWACVEAYGEQLATGDGQSRGYSEDRVIENARLLWIQREVGELWQPPL